LEAVYKQYYKQGLSIVGVNVTPDQEPTARAFVTTYKLTFPVGHDTSGEVISAYAVQSVPTIILVDKAGKLVERHVGELTKSELRQRIDGLLKQQAG
jgi:peroxiredoxin